jgi:hypothetical protein
MHTTHCSKQFTATTLCEHKQLIVAAHKGMTADVDRLIQSGANTEAKDRVRASASVRTD